MVIMTQKAALNDRSNPEMEAYTELLQKVIYT